MAPLSLIFTVLNEADNIQELLNSIVAQTRQPDEVIACDGGSRDDTARILRAERRLNLRVIEAPGANIARGRNIAIAAATHPLIACTDAGVRLHPRWLERLTAPFESPKPPQAVAGFFLPDPRTPFEVAMGATVLDGAVIESGGMLAAGALLTPGKRIGPGELWAGSPAKLMRMLSEEDAARFARTAVSYVGLARAHRGA